MSDPKKAVGTRRVKISAAPQSATEQSAAALAPDAVLVAASAIVYHYLPGARDDLARNPHKPLHVIHCLQTLERWVHEQFVCEAALFAAPNPEASALRLSERIYDLLQYNWTAVPSDASVVDTLRGVAELIHRSPFNVRLEVTPTNKQESKR